MRVKSAAGTVPDAAIARTLAVLADDRPMTRGRVERALLLAGDLPGVRIAGSTYVREGTRGVLIVDSVGTGFRGSVQIDNWGSRSVGPVRLRVRADVTGALLEEPYRATILTAAAPNATVVREHQPTRAGELPVVLRRRIERALAIAALHGHTRLVLGAWGCGVFGNDPELVADLFKEELSLRFDGVFDEVVFAVYDRTPDRRNIAPFEARFL